MKINQQQKLKILAIKLLQSHIVIDKVNQRDTRFISFIIQVTARILGLMYQLVYVVCLTSAVYWKRSE